MSARPDVVVAGGGANGLIAATTLARAGLATLLLERDADLGGQGRAIEFAPGFRAAPLATDAGWLPPRLARELGLKGLARLPHDAPLSVATAPGEFLTLWRDPAKAAEAIRRRSASDAQRWPEFTRGIHARAQFLAALYQTPAPDVDAGANELMPLLSLAQRFRGLGRADMIELLRVLPMSIRELLDDTLEDGALKAAIAPGGVIDHRQGPRSGATGYVFHHYLVGAELGVVRGRAPWKGGAAAFTRAAEAAARRAGVTLRTSAGVARVEIRDDAVAGVVLESGETIPTTRLLSTVDPRRTLFGWIDPVWLDPEFLRAVENLRYRGCTALVAYALDDLPPMPGLAREALAGVLSLTPDLDRLERAADAAKYGRVSERAHVEVTVPTIAAPELAPPGQHVVVARAQYTPYRLRDGDSWDATRREDLADQVTASIDAAIPGFAARVRHRAAWTPLDLEERFGLTEGAPTHGELGLDQILFMRPLPGWGRHTTPIRGLYLGGAGTHPGPGILGGPGWLAARRALSERNGKGSR